MTNKNYNDLPIIAPMFKDLEKELTYKKPVKYYVFSDMRFDGGSLEECDTIEEAIKKYKENIDSENIILGIKLL